jgi:hypothetical protein
MKVRVTLYALNSDERTFIMLKFIILYFVKKNFVVIADINTQNISLDV